MGRASVALTRAGSTRRSRSGLSRARTGGAACSSHWRPHGGERRPLCRVDRVAVSIGPGGFSGIRTGVAAARGIGLAAHIPVVGATSFRIMAEASTRPSKCRKLLGLPPRPALTRSIARSWLAAESRSPISWPCRKRNAALSSRARRRSWPGLPPPRSCEGGFVSLPVRLPGFIPMP